jgi:HK97 family phage major capsid protein
MTRIKVTGGDDRYPNAVRVTWVGDTPVENQADINSPTFGVVRTPIHIVKATVPVPLTLLEDSAFPLVDKINSWVADAYAIDENEQFLIGMGRATPLGLLPGGLNLNGFSRVFTGDADGMVIVSTTPGTTVAADIFKDLKHAVKRQYRAGCQWWMNDTTAGFISKLKDKNDRYIYVESLKGEDEPDTLLGYPVNIDEAMPDIAASAFPVVFGNPKGYQIADRIGMSVTRDDITQNEEDIVKFLFRRRLGAQPTAEWLFSVLQISAS